MEGRNITKSEPIEDVVRSQLESSCFPHQNKSFDDIFGLETCCDMLKENVVLPFRFPHLYTKPERTFMLFGLPGSGKSILLSVAANASGAKLFVFNVWCLQGLYMSKYSTDDIMKAAFKIARDNSPSILCFEDIEILSRDDMGAAKASFRNEIHHFLHNDVWDLVVVIGVSTKPWEVDSSVRELFSFSPGSHTTLPDAEARLKMLKSLCDGNTSHTLKEEHFLMLASKTAGFTGADIACLVRGATYLPISRLSKATHFKKVLVKKELDDKQAKSSDEHEEGEQDHGVNPDEGQDSRVSNPIPNQSSTADSNSASADCENESSKGAKNAAPDASKRSPEFPNNGEGSDFFDEKFIPCDAEDIGAIPVSVMDLPLEKVQVDEELSMRDLEEELSRARSSVDKEHLEKMLLFGSEYCTGKNESPCS